MVDARGRGPDVAERCGELPPDGIDGGIDRDDGGGAEDAHAGGNFLNATGGGAASGTRLRERWRVLAKADTEHSRKRYRSWDHVSVPWDAPRECFVGGLRWLSTKTYFDD